MKNIPIVLFSLLLTLTMFSQEEKMDYIVIKTNIIDQEKLLTSNTKAKLQSRITQIATNYGFSAVENEHNFTMSIDFHLYEKNIITGLKTMTAINGELFLTIYNSSSKIQYASLTHTIAGIGDDQNKAIANAIKKIDRKHSDFQEYFEKAKLKIFDFYDSSCEVIIVTANNLYLQQKYTDVLSTLSSIPMNVDNCRNQITVLISKSYSKLQNKNCNKILTKAKTEIADNNLGSALKTLKYIDPESSCFSEALDTVKNIRNEIDQNDLRAWDLLLTIYNDQVALESHRLEVIKEIGVAYYTDEVQENQKTIELIIIK